MGLNLPPGRYNMIMKRLIALALMLGAVLVSARQFAAVEPAATGPAVSAAVVSLSGEIDDYNRDSFKRRFNQARGNGAKVILVRINTYGGLVTAGLDLSRFIKAQNEVHTVAYVDDKAISAGAMIAMACDEIVMSDSAVLGDCAPISYKSDGGLEPLPAAERAKIESPILADFEDSARRNHHDPLLADAMVDVKAEVYWVQSPDGEKRFVDPADYAKLTAEGWKPVAGVRNPVDPADRLLTVSTPLAVQLGLATGPSSSVEVLARQRGWTITDRLDSGMGEAIIAMLNTGWLRMILITVFGTAIYAALHAPGHGTAEAIAVTSLGLLLGVPLLAGYATWWEIGLILGGLAMIAFEIFVFPHAGIMIVGGLLMMGVGLILTFVGGEPGGFSFAPHLPATWANLKNGVFYVAGGLIGSALLCWWLSQYLPQMPYFGRLILTTTNGGVTSGTTRPSEWPAVGSVGRAVTPLKPGGSAEFADVTGADVKVFSVVCETGYLAAGSPVIVRESSGGGRVVVRSTV